MIVLRVPNRNVTPAVFPGRHGVCQNLGCLALLDPPYQGVRLSLPGGSLETVLCPRCLPPPWGRIPPEMRLEVVEAAAVLAPPGRSAAPPGKSRRPPTFRALARLEPRLRDLFAEACSYHRHRGPVFCANAVWYGYPGYEPGLKNRLCRLVGWGAERSGELVSSAAYDVAYHTIYRALPDCRGRCPCSAMLRI